MYIGLHVKCPVFLSDLNENWNFSLLHIFEKNTQISDFMEIRPVGAELFRAHRQIDLTDRIFAFFAILRTLLNLCWNSDALIYVVIRTFYQFALYFQYIFIAHNVYKNKQFSLYVYMFIILCMESQVGCTQTKSSGSHPLYIKGCSRSSCCGWEGIIAGLVHFSLMKEAWNASEMLA